MEANISLSAASTGAQQFMLFSVFKRNKAGKYQPRVLLVDCRSQVLSNLHGEKVRKQFPFRELHMVDRGGDNPLQLNLYFKQAAQYVLFTHSLSDRERLVGLLEQVAANAQKGLETHATSSRTVVKCGGTSVPEMVGWGRRYLVLHKFVLFVYRQASAERPLFALQIYNTPINPEGERDVRILIFESQYLFRFDTEAERNAWFDQLLRCSQEESEIVATETEKASQMETQSSAVHEHQGKLETQLRRTAEEIESLRLRQLALQQEVKAVDASRLAMQAELRNRRDERARAEAARNAAAERVSSASARIAAAEEFMRSSDEEMTRVLHRKANAEAGREAALAQVAEVVAGDAAARAELAEAEGAVARAEAERAEQLQALLALQGDGGGPAAQLGALQSELVTLKDRIDERTSALHALQAEAASIRSARAAAAQSSAASSELQQLEHEIAALEAQREALRAAAAVSS